jgi:uncharacterized protein (TIGR02147 family)
VGAKKHSIHSKPNIFMHHDYRSYLNEYFAFLQTTTPSFTVKSFAEKVGLSNSLLSLILKGERTFTDDSFDKVIAELKLQIDEIEFFKILVTMADAKDPKDQDKALQTLIKKRRFRNLNPNEFEVLEYLSKWYYLAIRKMASFPDFKKDPKWIQTQLKEKFAINEIKKSLKFLEEKGFIAFDDSGKAFLPEKIFDCKDGMFKVALSRFHKHMLDQAKASIDINDRNERKQIGTTTALTSESFKKAQQIIEDAQKKINELEVEQGNNPDAVYYLNFSMFPLVRGGK